MSGIKGMNIYEKRLASFRPKRRPSSTAGSKLVSTKWPHEQPSPKKLSEAGFYFNPTDSHPDNVTCYLCNKDLDGWEYEDDPSIEHLKHCPDCGWARVAVTQAVDDDRKHVDDPRGDLMTEARLMTFGKKWWPHEDKRGWLPKMEKMADAGWHYAPSKESNDFAICAYCELSLDGWEATDNPLEEHQRRSPSCVFFNWKPTKRPTKKSRTSLQPTANPAPSLYDDEDEPVAPAKKAPRAKKAKKLELEPEPEPEPEPIAESAEPARGRKRPSVARQGPVIIYDGSKDTDSEPDSQPPPPKKRATRASLAQGIDQSHDQDGDRKMTDNSDNDSAASRASVMSKTTKPTKKKPGRRPSRARAPSKTRAAGRKPRNAPSDDELDRALAADLERPLTDEEEGFKDFKKPFIRPAKRLTRSRASLAVEESAKDAPEGVLVYTSTSARRGRSRTPAGDSEKGKAPMRGFFRESSQDFSMPVKIPRHLVQEEILPVGGKSPERKRQEEVAESIMRGFSREQTDVEEPEVQVKPKKQPAKKAAKGRKKVSEVTVADEEAEAPKPKRGRPPKKVAGTRSRSNSVERDTQAPSQTLEIEVESPKQEVTVEYEQPPEIVPEKPKRGRKGKLVKGAAAARSSVISIASTVTLAPEEATEPEPEPALEPRQSFMDVDPTPEDASDAGSVIRYDVSVDHPILPATSDAEAEPKEPTPQKPTKRTKKTSAGVAKTKKSTRSSVLSQATTVSMSTDGAGSIINSGDESDISRASRTGATKKGRKVAKKPSKRQLLQQNRNIEDALKKGSESFFNSSQSEELANDSKRGRGKKALGGVDTASTRGSVRGSFNEKSSVRGSFVSESGDVHMVEAAVQEIKAEARPAGSRVVSWADAGYPRLPAAPDEELSATDVDQEEEHVQSPANIAPSPARRPLSPVRTAVNIPLAATPKSHGKNAGRLVSSKPWTAVDLEVVLANLNTADEEEGDEVLSGKEMDMTVEEWIRYSATQAEFRMAREAERIIDAFEREGRRAVDAVEGVDTVD